MAIPMVFSMVLALVHHETSHRCVERDHVEAWNK
jgi:hypothetical protein